MQHQTESKTTAIAGHLSCQTKTKVDRSRWWSKYPQAGRVIGLLAVIGLPAVATAATCSGNFCTLDMNSTIWINNNVWGRNSSPAGWSESITTLGANSWRTDFNWPLGANNNSVKAYPSAVLGWHYGWHFPMGSAGLPTQLSANRSVNTSYSYTANFGSGGTANVAYDLWLHTQSNPGSSSTPSDEIMIWLNRTGGAGPIGSSIATVNIGGATWDLRRGNIGWEVWSFIRTSNSGSGSLNLRDFTDYLRSNWGLSSSKYLSSVQFGTEVFHGVGNLTVNNYTCTVGGGSPSVPVPAGTYSLRNRASQKMLDNLGSLANGASVAQWADGSSPNQRWVLSYTGSYAKLMCVTGNKFLDSVNQTADNTPVGQWDGSTSFNQQWTIQSLGGGFYKLINRANNKCLDSGGALNDGGIMEFWGSGASFNQQWQFVAP